MSADPTERALLLLSLLQTHRFWPGEELTGRLGVSARTLRRDVDRLRSLGYPVDATPGSGGGYRLAAGAHLPPLLLDDDEAVAIAVGLRSAASASIDGMEDIALRALAKLEQVLPDRLRRRVLAVHTNVASLQWSDGGPVVDAEALAVLALACRDREQVRFDYRRRDGDDSSRLVDPYQLVSTGRRWYLVAWDVRRDDWRTFRLDRLEGRGSRVDDAGCASCPAVTPLRSSPSRSGRCRSPRGRCSTSTRLPTPCAARSTGVRRRSTSATTAACRVRIEGGSDDALLRVVTWLAARHAVAVVEPPSLAARVGELVARLS